MKRRNSQDLELTVEERKHAEPRTKSIVEKDCREPQNPQVGVLSTVSDAATRPHRGECLLRARAERHPIPQSSPKQSPGAGSSFHPTLRHAVPTSSGRSGSSSGSISCLVQCHSLSKDGRPAICGPTLSCDVIALFLCRPSLVRERGI